MPPNPRKEHIFEIHVAVFSPDFFHGAVFADNGTNKARHLLFFTQVMNR